MTIVKERVGLSGLVITGLYTRHSIKIWWHLEIALSKMYLYNFWIFKFWPPPGQFGRRFSGQPNLLMLGIILNFS